MNLNCLFLCALCLLSRVQNYMIGYFPKDGSHRTLNHVVINRNNGRLFLGAVNRLHQLSPELNDEVSIKLGPLYDDPNCDINVNCLNKHKSDNHNKLLLIDYKNRKLIICTTLFHGVCEWRNLDDLSQFRSSNVPMVANDINSSTVAFIGPGPKLTLNNKQSDVLYISVSWSNTGLTSYQYMKPAFSMRNLSTFDIYYKSLTVSSEIDVESTQKMTFPIRYITGFSARGFSYMLTVQRKDISSEKYISKIFRICQNDKNFYSFVELEMVCMHLGANFNLLQAASVAKPGLRLARGLGVKITEDVLFAAFSVGYPNTADPTASSALCIYPLSYLERIFHKNIVDCFKGIGKLGPNHYMAGGNCISSTMNLDYPYCGEYDINQPIAGHQPIVAEAILGFKGHAPISSLSVTVTHKYTVAFVGLKNGHLRKVAIKSLKKVHEYEDLTIEEGSAINSDMPFDIKHKTIYVLTKNKIRRLRVENCSRYETCLECMKARDPYCGWCSVDRKCTTKSRCSAQVYDVPWLPYDSNKCTSITKVVPNQLQRTNDHVKSAKIDVVIQSLPSTRGHYTCVFVIEHFNHTSDAILSNSGVQCHLPPFSKLPDFTSSSDHLVLNLIINFNGQRLVASNITIYDCSVHKSCVSCVSAHFPCDWCIENYMCTHDNHLCQGNSLVLRHRIVGIPLPPDSIKCPMFLYKHPTVDVIAGRDTQISVAASNVVKYTYSKSIKCFFDLGPGREVPATIRGNVITCDHVKFNYADSYASHDVPFKILWGSRNYPLDNPSNIHVKIYKCGLLSESCGQCLMSSHLCGWCQGNGESNSCTSKSLCEGTWLNHSSICPNPRIIKFYPVKGPYEGGTNITIIGENLGKLKEDIHITVAGIDCDVSLLIHDRRTRIHCVIQSSAVEHSGKVIVNVAKTYTAESEQLFHYVEPSIKSISPGGGPLDGGTIVTVVGDHLDAGTSSQIIIGNTSCSIIRESLSSSKLNCTASKVVLSGVRPIILKSDNLIYNTSVSYVYYENPTFKIPSRDTRQSIVSGGLTKSFYGTNLNVTVKPRLVFWRGKDAYFGKCVMISSKNLDCVTPNLTSALNKHKLFPLRLDYGFIMDSVSSVAKLPSYKYGRFTIHRDPRITPFSDEPLSFTQDKDLLHIHGMYLYPNEHYYFITIGNETCRDVSVINASSLRCTPPKQQPVSVDGSTYPKVIVKVGNWSVTVGRIAYEEPSLMSTMKLVGIAVGVTVVLLLLVIVAIFVVILKKKSQTSSAIKKDYESKIQELQSKIRKESKKVFVEFQTSVKHEVFNNLSGVGEVPTWDYQSFCMNILFPNQHDHPITRSIKVAVNRREETTMGLQLVFALVTNDKFLLTFIDILESDSNFRIQERVEVASLICLVCHRHLDYLTRILKILLSNLISKSVKSKDNSPELLLRRNESIVEKMLTNWFAFLLYDFLKDSVGEKLYVLFQAIKLSLHSGPVDAVSGEAQNSLSEDKLIRQDVEYKQLTLNVVNCDDCNLPVRVLDCDSIDQVKQKILESLYRHISPSCRPLIDGQDLEWQLDNGTRVILHNCDERSKAEGNYVRVNTLAHYGVRDNAVVALVSKQPSLYSLPQNSDKSINCNGETSTPLHARKSAFRREKSPIYEEISRNKLYHLVNPDDSDHHKDMNKNIKLVSEVYLMRSLKTKEMLKDFIDKLFKRIFSTYHNDRMMPCAVKYLFDFFDYQAAVHDIRDPKVIHAWKSNSLPLRFWVNIIINPNFIFDVQRSHCVDSCLSVIAQAFMDSCSMHDFQITPNSPSSKVLFHQEIKEYRKLVEQYYHDIKRMDPVSDDNMANMLNEHSELDVEFNTTTALYEIYKYMRRYHSQLHNAFPYDSEPIGAQLAQLYSLHLETVE